MRVYRPSRRSMRECTTRDHEASSSASLERRDLSPPLGAVDGERRRG
jgi:hypothetical protein